MHSLVYQPLPLNVWFVVKTLLISRRRVVRHVSSHVKYSYNLVKRLSWFDVWAHGRSRELTVLRKIDRDAEGTGSKLSYYVPPWQIVA